MAEGLKALPSTYRFTHNQSGQFYPIRKVEQPLIKVQILMLPVLDGTCYSSIMVDRLVFMPPMNTLLVWRQSGGKWFNNLWRMQTHSSKDRVVSCGSKWSFQSSLIKTDDIDFEQETIFS